MAKIKVISKQTEKRKEKFSGGKKQREAWQHLGPDLHRMKFIESCKIVFRWSYSHLPFRCDVVSSKLKFAFPS